MSPSSYLAFALLALVVVLAPGPDFAVVVRNTLAGGRTRGLATASGVATACAVQGTAAALGLGALIAASQPLFQAIRWAGVAYLAWLAVGSLRAAWRGDHPPPLDATAATRTGLREGFVSNIVNPKVLVFYLAVLPQFVGGVTHPAALLLLALTHAVLGWGYLTLLTVLLGRLRPWLQRRAVRRGLDAATGVALAGFSVGLALRP